MLDEAFKRVAVLGAAGKMGSGIAMLLLQEMTRLEARSRGRIGSGEYLLTLIDTNEKALIGLKHYLRSQMRRYAEKNINELRNTHQKNPGLISNEDMIDAYVEGALDIVNFESEVTAAGKSALIFEAILENVEVKSQVFSLIDSTATGSPYYFSNTSSIPIGMLSQESGIQGRLIGFHFYNPPPVQRLMEIIPAEDTESELVKYAEEIAKRLGKVVIISKDVAGFIGNGHFIREIDHVCRKVKELELTYSRKQAIWMMNRVTQDFLVRPMGTFQLMDYVGIDVCHKVITIMSEYLDYPFEKELIEELLAHHVLGGQNADGTQKNGIFQYTDHRLEKIWEAGKYIDLPKDDLGPLPEGHVPWKKLLKDPNKDSVLKNYFHNLFAVHTKGAELAKDQLYASRKIARKLVVDGVARNISDVNTSLKNGFYHLYGADAEWIPEGEKARSSS